LRKSHSIALSEKRWITKSYSDGWKGFKYAKDVEELKMRYCRTYRGINCSVRTNKWHV